VTADCTLGFVFAPRVSNVSVKADVGPGGSINPAVQVINRGNRAEFSVNPQSGYNTDRSVGGSCAIGTWSGNRYTTGDIHNDCRVSFRFISASYAVTAMIESGGRVEPTRQTIAGGGNASFQVQAEAGYRVNSAVGGSCVVGGWSGDTYTTGPVRDNCTVRFSSTAEAHTVTAGSGFGGTVTTTTRSVISGGTTSFTVIPDFGYARSTSVGGDCPVGSWIGDTYTTGELSKSCSVEFNFHYIH
jgi:hypothetical protein